jgi:hypothetical protein
MVANESSIKRCDLGDLSVMDLPLKTNLVPTSTNLGHNICDNC